MLPDCFVGCTPRNDIKTRISNFRFLFLFFLELNPDLSPNPSPGLGRGKEIPRVTLEISAKEFLIYLI